MQAFRLALSFLTILPGGISEEIDKDVFNKSIKYFPVVGLLIGLILLAAYTLISPRLEEPALSMLIITILIIVTRALHLDGVADTFDGMLGGRDKDRILEIMKDSRVGSFGVVAIVLVIALKVAFLSTMPESIKQLSLVLMPVIGRWSAYYAILTQPRARNDGLGSLFIQKRGLWQLAPVSIIAFGLAGVLLKMTIVAMILALAAFLFSYIRLVNKKIGGMTGDTLGAIIELSEVVVLIALAVG